MSNINKIRLSGTTYDIEDLNAAKTVELTQAQYDALVTKDPNTFYIITDAEPVDMSDYYTKSEVDTALGAKQATLVSGTNLKTVNNESLLGEGNIEIQGGGATYSAGTNISIDANNAISCTIPLIVTGSSTYPSSFKQDSNSSVSNPTFYSAVLGRYNIVSMANRYDVFMTGYNNTASNDEEAVFGKFNRSNRSSDTFGHSGNTLFSVGNGAYHANHNAFEIRQNGDIYISKDGVDVKLQDQLGGSSVDVDTQLDSLSENPVQNKVIYQKFDEVEEVTAAALNALNDKIGDINTLLEGI